MLDDWTERDEINLTNARQLLSGLEPIIALGDDVSTAAEGMEWTGVRESAHGLLDRVMCVFRCIRSAVPEVSDHRS